MSRVALISGGTSGIGAAIARALQAAGYRVAVNYAFTTDRAEAFQKETGIPAERWAATAERRRAWVAGDRPRVDRS